MNTHQRNGFTVVELLIAIAIVTFLLAAMAFGLKSGLKTYDENDRLAQVTQTARMILTRIATEVRTAPGSSFWGVSSTSLSIPECPTDSSEVPTIARYSFTGETLYYDRNINAYGIKPPLTNVLVGKNDEVRVTKFLVESEYDIDENNGNLIMLKVVVTLELECHGVTYPYTITATPRSALAY